MSRSTTNESQGDANESSIDDLETAVSANTSKTGITSSQASAITANTSGVAAASGKLTDVSRTATAFTVATSLKTTTGDLVVRGSTAASDATITLDHGTSGTGFRLNASAAGNALYTWKDTAGSASLLEARTASSVIRQDIALVENGLSTGSQIHRDSVSQQAESITHQSRFGSSMDGFDVSTTGASGGGSYDIKRVVGGVASSALSVHRMTGAVEFYNSLNTPSVNTTASTASTLAIAQSATAGVAVEAPLVITDRLQHTSLGASALAIYQSATSGTTIDLGSSASTTNMNGTVSFPGTIKATQIESTAATEHVVISRTLEIKAKVCNGGGGGENPCLLLSETCGSNPPTLTGAGMTYNGSNNLAALVAWDSQPSADIQAPSFKAVEFDRAGTLVRIRGGGCSIGSGTVLAAQSSFVALDIQGGASQGVRLPNLTSANATTLCTSGLAGTIGYDTGLGRLILRGSNTAKRQVADSGSSIVAHVAVASLNASASGVMDTSKARTTAFTELSGAGDVQAYPTVALDLSAGDQIEVSGHLAVDVASYNDSPDHARISIWRGAVGSGTLLNPASGVLGGSGDNRSEVQSINHPARRFTINTAGVHTICWAIACYNINPRAIGVLNVQSFIQATRHRSVIIPIF